jgi:hypothetical protein
MEGGHKVSGTSRRDSLHFHSDKLLSNVYIDATIFTVAQLRFYLKSSQVQYPDGCPQNRLLNVYHQHLAGRIRPEGLRFDWPGKAIPSLDH